MQEQSPKEEEQQWMVKNIPLETLSYSLIQTKKHFFGTIIGHGYDVTRLYWLQRWIEGKEGQVPESFYQDEDLSDNQQHNQQHKRMKFLTAIWNDKNFQPFFSVNQSYDAVENILRNANSPIAYCISLSSTHAGFIRLTYFSRPDSKIYHRRINIDIDVLKGGIKTKLDYNFEKIHRYIIDYVCEKNQTRLTPVSVVYTNHFVLDKIDYK